MPREPFIDECVVCIEKIDDAAIFTNDAFEEHLHLALKR